MAGKVGGIPANSELPTELLADNLAITDSHICAAHKCDVRKLYLGTSYINLRMARQPITEEMLSG